MISSIPVRPSVTFFGSCDARFKTMHARHCNLYRLGNLGQPTKASLHLWAPVPTFASKAMADEAVIR
jgi:hypothetical protein